MSLGTLQFSDDQSAAGALVDLMLSEPDDFVEETLVWAVVAHRTETVAPLLDRLGAIERGDWPDTDVSADDQLIRILHTLSKIEDPSTALRVVAYAHDDRRGVQTKAWWALARMGVPETLDVLLAHVGEADTERRVALARALVHWGLPALAPLSRLLEDPREEVREHAADLMVRILNPNTRGTSGRRRLTSTQSEQIDAATRALTESDSPQVHTVLVQLSLEFQDPGLSETAEDLLARRRP